MDREALRQRLMATFLGELEEHVQALNRDLLALEAGGGSPPALVSALFRSAHSLKGAARAVGVQPIEAACHRLEALLARARDGQYVLDASAIQLFLTAADALADAGRRLRAHDDVGSGPLQALMPALDRAATGRTAAVEPAPADPEPIRSIAEPPAPARGAPRPARAEGIARVPVDKLDRLIGVGGEFLVARRRAAAGLEALVPLRDELRRWRSDWARIEPPLRALASAHPGAVPARAAAALQQAGDRCAQLEHRLDLLASRLAADAHDLDRAATRLENEIRSVRMFPFHQACDGLARTVRDLAVAGGKQVRLAIEGGDVELGRFVLEHLRDPLLHLTRNALDHGIEVPAERQARGKPAEATLRISAALRGGAVEIAVADDGRGLDLAAIREQAQRRGLAMSGDDRDDARLVFLAGVSTASQVTELSGRGVGLEIVRHQVEALNGHVDVASEPGRGTRIVITVPVTVATLRALLLAAGGQTFALPVVGIQQLARAAPTDVAVMAGRECLLREGAPVPLVPLADVLGMPRATPHRRGHRLPVVVVAAADRQAALVVDELIGEDEVLVKPLGARLHRVRHLTGATLLPSGRVALILNTAEVVATALNRPPGTPALTGAPDAGRGTPRLLVVDDSVTTRTLERSILETAGYDVVVAADGRGAWRVLQEQRIDLVVADVEMPRMDGIALCEAIRASASLRELPVVLVTALETPADRVRGLDAGANAYMPKSTFDQRTLLDTIADLL